MVPPPPILWEDDEGVVHEVLQGDGGEQGDALLPDLFSPGQHCSLEAIQARFRPSERLFAFLDDICAVCSSGRTADVFTTIQEQLATVGIRVHDGKTQLWNRAGRVPTGAQALTAAARKSDPDAIVWRGDTTLPPEAQGVTILGTPLGHEEFVRARLVTVSAKHDRLISQIVGIPELQCAWILLLYCAAARPNYILRVVHPTYTSNFAAHHDASLRRVLSQLVAAPPTHMFWDVACLPFSRGLMGLRSAVLTSDIQQSRTRFSISWPTIRRQDSTLLRRQLQERS